MNTASVIQESSPPVGEPGAGADPGRWVDEHGDALFRYALFRLRDRSRAEDAVQEALLAAVRARGTYGGRSSVRNWLLGILKHKILDQFRKAKRETSLDDAEDPDAVLAEAFDEGGVWRGGALTPSATGSEPDVQLQRAEFWDDFVRSLGKIPSGQADAFVLKEVQGLSSDEVCDVLGITPQALWVRLHRARLSLQALMRDAWGPSV